MLAVDLDFVKMLHDKDGKVVVEAVINEAVGGFRPARYWADEKVRTFINKLRGQTNAPLPAP